MNPLLIINNPFIGENKMEKPIRNVVEKLTAKMIEGMKDDLYAKNHLCRECKEKHEDIFLVGNNCENVCEDCLIRLIILVQKWKSGWRDYFTNLIRRHPTIMTSKDKLYINVWNRSKT